MKRDQCSIDKSFVSDYDIFLAKFAKTHLPTASQLKERETHARIHRLRDEVSCDETLETLWEKF